MKLRIEEGSENFVATVVEIGEVFDIPNADNIKRVVLVGNNVIVSKAVQKGDVMIYFVAGTQLAEDFCHLNNLYTDTLLNVKVGEKGYINSPRRIVKSLKLRGTISDGMLLPLSSIRYIDQIDVKVGDTFTHINDVEVCKKYVAPVKQNGSAPQNNEKVNKMKDLLIENQFRLHTSTEHFARNLELFTPETDIIITRKMHGSSLILAHILTNKQLNWFEKLVNRFIKLPTSEYGFVYSSGKPRSKMPKGIRSESFEWDTKNGSFYSSDFWEKAYQMHKDKVEKGISIYAEIVGNGVQGSDYTYGFDYEIFVYRITQTNVDGNVYELSWEATKKYCEKYGLRHVQEFFSGKVQDIVGKHGTSDQLLGRLKEAYLDKTFPDCSTDEGVCVRIRETDEIFKLKSPKFTLAETNVLEEGRTENES